MSKSYGIYIHVYSRERERERETAFQTTERRLVAYTGPPLNSPFSDEIQSSTYYASVYVCRDFQFQPTQYTDPPMQPSIVHMVSCIQYERNCIREGALSLPPSLSLFLSGCICIFVYTLCARVFLARCLKTISRLTSGSRKMSLRRVKQLWTRLERNVLAPMMARMLRQTAIYNPDEERVQ